MRIPMTTRIKITHLQRAVHLLLVCIAISGCHGVTKEHDAAMSSPGAVTAGKEEASVADMALAGEGTSSSGPTQPVPSVSVIVDVCGFSPLSGKEYRRDPQLLEETGDILGSPIVNVWPFVVGRGSNKVFAVAAANGKRGWFVKREGHYVRLDSGAELIGINEVFRDYRFTRQDFNDPAIVFDFLSHAVSLCGTGQGMPASSHGLLRMGDLSSWLRGTEKDEAAIKKLCRDPEFIFKGNNWKVTFNMFRPGGSVSQFILSGRHDPQANANEILSMSVTTIRPPGTFSYPLGG